MLEPIACAFAYRIRGGIFSLPDWVEELAWALTVSACAYLATGEYLSLLAGVGAYIGNRLPHGHYFTMGGIPVNTNDWLKTSDVFGMAIIGFLRGACIGVFCNAWLLPLMCAITHPLAYSFKSTQKGEWFFGFSIGAYFLWRSVYA